LAFREVDPPDSWIAYLRKKSKKSEFDHGGNIWRGALRPAGFASFPVAARRASWVFSCWLREVPMMKSTAFVCGSVILMLTMSGCSGDTTGTTASGSSGSSGAGGAGGAGGGPPFPYPTCTPHQGVAILKGTLDGMPFDKTIPLSGSQLNNISKPGTIFDHFIPDGRIDLVWTGVFDNGKRHAASGTLWFDGETTKREVKVGSTIEFSNDGSFLMDLLLDNGELVACSNW
jgi:hypothetical protein